MNVGVQTIHNDASGYQQLISFYQHAHTCGEQEFILDFNEAGFDANICAPLGALVHRLRSEGKIISLGNMHAGVKRTLGKNAFLKTFGMVPEVEGGRAVMKYHRFEPSDEKEFPNYIKKHFKGKGIPKMSIGLTEKFREGIMELFSNAVLHSETQHGIFVCGQHFPQAKRLDFSIVDMGVGIRHNVWTKRKIQLSAENSIAWAMEGNNTTKTGSIPGGLGLKLIRDFIKLNQGRIQIVSDAGFWEETESGVTTHAFTGMFPGTLVNIEINTADKRGYRLATEAEPVKLF